MLFISWKKWRKPCKLAFLTRETSQTWRNTCKLPCQRCASLSLNGQFSIFKPWWPESLVSKPRLAKWFITQFSAPVTQLSTDFKKPHAPWSETASVIKTPHWLKDISEQASWWRLQLVLLLYLVLKFSKTKSLGCLKQMASTKDSIKTGILSLSH